MILGSISAALSSPVFVRRTWAHFPEQRLVIEPIMISVNTASDRGKNSPESLKEEFKSLFGGIGKVRNKTVKLHIDPNATPGQQPHRRIPFHVREDVEKELERFERLDIIEKMMGPHLGLVLLSSGYHQLELAPESKAII